MTGLLAPQVTLSPSDYSSEGVTVVATVSLLNRPAYHGLPSISGLTTITPKIIVSRSPAGAVPFHIAVSARETTHDGSNAANAYMDLDYRWSFGNASGTEVFTDWHNGQTVNANTDQQGPEASYIYRLPGTYTVTLTVRGKDGSGNIVTASTSSLYTVGQYLIHTGSTVSGTFTLSYDGETTAPIAHNATRAQKLAALHALTALDDTNCEINYYDMVSFHGNLAGVNAELTGDFSNIVQTTGLENTPRIITYMAPGVSPSVTVTDWSTLSVRYFDPTFAGGGDGLTESTPWNTFTQFEQWVEGGKSRVALLNRGTRLIMTSVVTFPLVDHSNMRIGAYGTGADPIIENSSTGYFNFRLGTGQSSQPNGRIVDDVVFSDVDIDFKEKNGTQSNSIYVEKVSQANAGAYPAARLSNLVLDRVKWYCSIGAQVGIPTKRLLSGTIDPGTNAGSLWSGFYCWDCDVNGADANHLALVVSKMDSWNGFIGGYYRGGGPDSTDAATIDKIHHLYPTATDHFICRWVRFGSANKGFCVNGNSHDSGASRFWVFDGCDITGAMNGIDLSNRLNAWSGADGYHHQVIVQFSKIHSGQLNSQQLGINSYNLDEITVRYCDFWDNTQSNIGFGNTTGYQWAPKLWAYYNRFYDGELHIRGTPFPQVWYFHHNTIVSVNGDTPMSFFNGTEGFIDEWDADYNIWHTNLSSPFDQSITFAAWQAAGNDANGQNTNPLWDDPGAGSFTAEPIISLNWPAGWTNLESSLDGTTWSAYTDNAELAVAASISARQIVYFRGRAPLPNAGTYNVVATSASSSVDVSNETYTAIVTATGTVIPQVYFSINTSAGSLLLSQAAQ